MPKGVRLKPEQIVAKLREIEVKIGQGKDVLSGWLVGVQFGFLPRILGPHAIPWLSALFSRARIAIIAFLCARRTLRVCVECFNLARLDRISPSAVLGPVDFPPCILQTDLPFTAGARQRTPLRLDLALHWLQLCWPKTKQRDSRNWVKVGFIRRLGCI